MNKEAPTVLVDTQPAVASAVSLLKLLSKYVAAGDAAISLNPEVFSRDDDGGILVAAEFSELALDAQITGTVPLRPGDRHAVSVELIPSDWYNALLKAVGPSLKMKRAQHERASLL